MYLSYYKLDKKPFQISTDPDFFWIGEKHKEALAILKYAVMDDKGFLLLTGDVGTGKTTLINTFVNSLTNEVITARVSDPDLTKLGFIKYIAKMFKMDTEFETKGEFLIIFTQFLEQAHNNKQKVLLIIDEAQLLPNENLEEIRLLSNIEKQDKKLLNIFLVGQNEFIDTLNLYKNRALRQRLTLSYTLYPFEPDETKACIAFRLAVAGAKKEIFTPEAIETIHSLSKGVPRIINMLCDYALQFGCKKQQETISAEIVKECSKEVHLANLLQSQQHKSFTGSTDDWLEDSEVPPLTSEAIEKASQPLPDFPSETLLEPEEPKRHKRKSLILPLLLIALLLSGFYVVKNDKVEFISQLLITTYSETIAPNLKKVIAAISQDKDTKQTEELTSPKEPIKQQVVEKSMESNKETDSFATNETIDSSKQNMEAPTNTEKNKPQIVEQQPQQPTIPVIADPVIIHVSEVITVPETISSNTIEHSVVREENKIESEVTAPQPPPPVTDTVAKTVIETVAEPIAEPVTDTVAETVTEPVTQTEKNIIYELEAQLPQTVESISDGIDAPSTPKETITKSEKPVRSPKKPKTVGQDDPGAVIDWLLKANEKN